MKIEHFWCALCVWRTCSCLSSEDWLPPFNEHTNVGSLCTSQNHGLVMLNRGVQTMNLLFRHEVLCWPESERYVPPRYLSLVWFMQSLGYCDVNRAVNWRRRGVEYRRDFQLRVTRAAFAMICHRTDDIGRYQLARHAEVFRILFEKYNSDRAYICQTVISLYTDMYNRCHVGEPKGRLRLIDKICSGLSTVRLIKMRAFFRRFSRACYTFDDFYREHPQANAYLGRSLANDTVFMNMLSSNLISAITSDSQLPQVVLKTRLLLQHYGLAAVKLKRQIDIALNSFRCAAHGDNSSALFGSREAVDSLTNVTDDTFPDPDPSFDEECAQESTFYIPDLESYRAIARQAEIGLFVEGCLLALVLANTVILSILLVQSRAHLSTATVLFIFNILFSNVLFISSFVCLFSDLLDDEPYGQLSDESVDGSVPPSLLIAETLNTHLFAAKDFHKHLVQETLYSLAQNGSLLGLTHLLVLVLVVIRRSMAGKAIHLSRKCVVSVFALVWLFLFATHIIFSALQFIAISNVDEMFDRLASKRQNLECGSEAVSEYKDIGERCDRIAPFYDFGVYLLRGHTFFTLTFLAVSLSIFALTTGCHWKVRKQHFVLGNGIREQAPQRRREMLFNTLLLSLTAYFISVTGQTFVEIAVFWVHERADVAEIARWFQLARIAAFADPLFNPILVSVRTPVLRRKLRWYVQYSSALFVLICCPWKWRGRVQVTRAKRRTSSTTATADSSNSHRTVTTHSEELTLKLLCTQQIVRSSSMCRKSVSSQTHNSIV